MSLNLPKAPASYDVGNEGNLRSALMAEDRNNRKKGQHVDLKGANLYLYAPNGTRYIVAVSNAGAITVTPG
jgi:hypothetical protein